MSYRGRESGFTLIELSVVIVIIGLIIGGVLLGQHLIRGAQMQGVIAEYQAFRSAVEVFRNDHDALPGDMANATNYWGAAHVTPATCATTASVGKETCNGNADGEISSSAGSNEPFRFWQHLVDSDAIPKAFYTGVSTVNGVANVAVPDANVPASKYPDMGWSVAPATTFIAGGANSFATQYFGTRHVLIIGATCASGTAMTLCAGLYPEDAWSIDKKIDDGRPAYGDVLSTWATNCTTAANQNDLTATYKVSYSQQACALYFVPGTF